MSVYLQDYLYAARRRKDIKNNSVTPPCSRVTQCLDNVALSWYCTPHVVQSVCIPEQSEGGYLPRIVDLNIAYPSCVVNSYQYCRAFNAAFDESFG